jgi:hypothetical protein
VRAGTGGSDGIVRSLKSSSALRRGKKEVTLSSTMTGKLRWGARPVGEAGWVCVRLTVAVKILSFGVAVYSDVGIQANKLAAPRARPRRI